MTKTAQFGLTFGALCPSIAEQLQEQGLTLDSKKATAFQKDMEYIVWLSIRGLLTSTERNRAEKRLFKEITRVLNTSTN